MSQQPERRPYRTAAFVAGTAAMLLVAVYSPIMASFSYIWSPGSIPPASSVLVVCLPPVVWLTWQQIADTDTGWRRHVVWATAAAVAGWHLSMLVHLAPRLWTPPLAVAVVGYMLVSWQTYRTFRT